MTTTSALLSALLTTIFFPLLQSKSAQDYLQLSLGIPKHSSFFTEFDEHRALRFHELDLEQGVLMSIGCCSYDNGRDAGFFLSFLAFSLYLSTILTLSLSHLAMKYSTYNDNEILISPYFVSLDDDAMCFIIFSEAIPDQAVLTEFDQILPYPAPLKINGIYDDIFSFWSLQPQTEAGTASAPSVSATASDSKLFLYLDSLLSDSSPLDEGSTDSFSLHYDLYVSTFQFQYRPALMGRNGSDNLLQQTSQNIFTYVTNNLYYDPTPIQTQETLASAKWTEYRQPLADLQAAEDDPCGYDMIDHYLHDVCFFLSIPLSSPPPPPPSLPFSPSLTLSSAHDSPHTEQHRYPDGIIGGPQKLLTSLHLPCQFTFSILDSTTRCGN
jgi:hypothetical protein